MRVTVSGDTTNLVSDESESGPPVFATERLLTALSCVDRVDSFRSEEAGDVMVAGVVFRGVP